MRDHVYYLLAAYVNRQLPRRERSRVLLHTQMCSECRAALEREEQLAYDLRTLLPTVGKPEPGQLRRLWPTIWSLYRGTPTDYRPFDQGLKSVGMALVLFAVCVIVTSAVFGGTVHADAAPLPPVPAEMRATDTPVHTDSPAVVAVIALPSEVINHY